MNQGHPSATGAITQTTQSQVTPRAAKKRSAIPQPYQRADGKWSVRARRMGTNIHLSGFDSEHAARRAMAIRLHEISERGLLPHGQGPDRTTLGKAMQQYALQYLPRLRSAAQETRRINMYLRAARLASIEVCRVGSKKLPPPGAAFGRHFAVWLAPHEKNQRNLSQEPKDDGDGPLTGTARLGSVRAALANLEMTRVAWCHVQDLVCAMEAEGLACATVLRELQLLRRLFNCAIRDWNWSALNTPAVGVRVTGRPNRRVRVMSPQEQQKLEEAARAASNPAMGPVFAFLTDTGMHARECINSARWEDIDWEKCILRLPSRGLGSCGVPLSPQAMGILREHRLEDTPEGKVFNISFASLKSQWKRLCESAGIKDLRIGDLRRTAAVRLMHSSGNVFAMLAVTGFRSARFSRW